jgi:hypothetical protein
MNNDKPITFIMSPDAVGMGRVKFDDRYYELPVELIKIFCQWNKVRRALERDVTFE